MAESSNILFSAFFKFQVYWGEDLKVKNNLNIQRLTFSAVSLALCLVLPFITGQVPEIGNMLCPMHIPVIICGYVCGAPWGLVVGFVAPLLRSVTLGMPPLFPTALQWHLSLQYTALHQVFYITDSRRKR